MNDSSVPMSHAGPRTVPSRPSRRHTATVIDFLAEQSAAQPDREYLRCGDNRRTFAELAAAADSVAAGLAELGVQPGDRVALLVPNRIETVEAFFGCARLGAVCVPLNTFLKHDFLQYQIDDSGAQVAIVDAAGLGTLVPILPRLPDLRVVVTVDDGARADVGERQLVDFSVVQGAQRAKPLPAPPTPHEVGAILYTSGTTGMPKGCIAPHGYLVHVGETFAIELMGHLRADDIVYSTMPLYHLAGMACGMLAPLIAGIPVVLDAQFSASGFVRRLIDSGATVTMGTGAMANAILATPAGPADRAHRLRQGSYAPLEPARQREFTARFGAEVGGLGYGQTECFNIGVALPPGTVDDPSGLHQGPKEMTPPWVEVRIVDADDIELPPGKIGQIVVRPNGPNVMFSGYWNKPHDTIETFRNQWHHTGDLGVVDANGYLTFCGRTMDVLRRRGENLSAYELELAIIRHPAIVDVAVHAVPSPIGEDDVKAWVVIGEGCRLEPAELFQFFKERLPYFGVPRYVEFVDEVPRNHSGKALKKQLRERPVKGPETYDFEALGLVVSVADRRGAAAAVPRN